MKNSCLTLTCLMLLVMMTSFCHAAEEESDPQYELDNQKIPAASKEEPVLKNISAKSALNYVELGAKAWVKNKSCVSCHTNGTYLFIRPSISDQVGPPSKDIKKFFVSHLEELKKVPADKIRQNAYPGEVIYLTTGLTEWDKHLEKGISIETKNALTFMLSLQKEDGTWTSQTCWPPFESSSYQLATMAAMALGNVPEWLSETKNEKVIEQFQNLKKYLVETKPPHNYAKVLLLWSSTRLPGLTNKKQNDEIIKMIWEKQKPDGGWAIRDFAKPEEWGEGNREDKLKEEADYKNPPSDGHQTGLAVVVLRDAGVPMDDPRIQKAVKWLKSNQRSSGRWWTQSLNTDGTHYITYSATCYALLALAKCDALPKAE